MSDRPAAGHYWHRVVKDGPKCAVRIWYGPPHDPLTGEEMDRSWRWQALLNGRLTRVYGVWPYCADRAITEAEYDYLLALHRHAVEHEPDMPEAAPRSPINHLTSETLF